jgi:hypothetical protein
MFPTQAGNRMSLKIESPPARHLFDAPKIASVVVCPVVGVLRFIEIEIDRPVVGLLNAKQEVDDRALERRI